ncbi:trypsin-like serine protease [Roseateles toxinivorans]|uniref:Putative secreted protein with PEP-CTERM sorting signal n=1 Tax=Roseateles toxinivorans TaxID=270368 RepID=A0A4R6QPY3_9BURK|nr:trypsin-like serine protease [Roseateles toxinivorans]TDP72763.1 putative secreted protein with PEP-CTERM sorting signal [Roseateles toxinivorans]
MRIKPIPQGLLILLLASTGSAQAIVGGIDTSAFGQVSNGVQIAPNWVVTARHVGLGLGDTFSNGYGSSPVAARYNMGGGAFPLNDLALVRLADSINAPVLNLNASALGAGSSYDIAATIVTGRNQVPRGYAWSSVREFMPTYDEDDAGPMPPLDVNWLVTYLDGFGAPYVQGGDSGGALFLGQIDHADANSLLWGIASAQLYDEDANQQAINYRSGFVQLASYRNWIDSTMSTDLADGQMASWMISSVPEPAPQALLALGLLALAWRRHRLR